MLKRHLEVSSREHSTSQGSSSRSQGTSVTQGETPRQEPWTTLLWQLEQRREIFKKDFSLRSSRLRHSPGHRPHLERQPWRANLPMRVHLVGPKARHKQDLLPHPRNRLQGRVADSRILRHRSGMQNRNLGRRSMVFLPGRARWSILPPDRNARRLKLKTLNV